VKTVPTVWIEGPDGVLSVRTHAPKDFVVWQSDAEGDPVLFRSSNKNEAIGWAKCKVGITAANGESGKPAPNEQERPMHATDITATVVRPDDERGSGWNWAEAATEAWLAAARDAGLAIEAEDHDYRGESVAACVRADGTWYELEIGRGGNPDEVRAVPQDAGPLRA